jgi:hypothetical protein
LLALFLILPIIEACGGIQASPKLQNEEIIELGCKEDRGLIVLYTEGDFLFPAEMPAGCRCFILINQIEYVTTLGGSSAKCNKPES